MVVIFRKTKNKKITQKIETLQKRKNEFKLLSNEERNKYNLAKQKIEELTIY